MNYQPGDDPKITASEVNFGVELEKTKHTPGPMEHVAGSRLIGIGDERKMNYVGIAAAFLTGDGVDMRKKTDKRNANARLLAAAYTSYDKHCGPRAIECAESDLLGKLIEACKSAADLIETKAADIAYKAGLGVGEWESFLTDTEVKALIKLADCGVGTWGREPENLERMKQMITKSEDGNALSEFNKATGGE